MPMLAGCFQRAITRAHVTKSSSGAVMSVGRKRVTPVRRIASAAWSSSAVPTPGRLKSTPAKPFTWRSKSPGNSILMTRLPSVAALPRRHRPEGLLDVVEHGQRAVDRDLQIALAHLGRRLSRVAPRPRLRGQVHGPRRREEERGVHGMGLDN